MFRTRLNYELQIPLPPELFGGESDLRHWRAFELVIHDYWFIVEFLVEEEAGVSFWKTIMSSELQAVLDLVASAFVIEHRINLVIPVHGSEKRQIETKPIIEIIKADEKMQPSMTIYVTSDGLRYVDSSLSTTEADAQNKVVQYLKKNIDIRPQSTESND